MADVQQQRQQHVSGWADWVIFAAFMLTLSGVVHILFGIGGIFGQDWYVYSNGEAVLFDASAWGWTMIFGGALLLITASLLAAGNALGRIAGLILASLSLLANLAMVRLAPVWSLIVIALDVLIIYAISVHGGELKRLKQEEQYRT